jgi:hypothetical protein
MKTRLYDPKDYPLVSPWWPAHGWPMIAEAVLPKCGIVVEDDEGVARAASWLYMSNSNGVSMMEWTVTNPLNKPKESFRAVQTLIGAMRELALLFDYGMILTTAKQPALIRLYEKSGFEKTDQEMTHLIMVTK